MRFIRRRQRASGRHFRQPRRSSLPHVVTGRDSKRENDILPDHCGGLSAEGGVLTSLEWPFKWSWCHGLQIKRLELACCQFSSLVLEIPATLEYIDLEEPPGRIHITKIGGYPTGLGSEAGGRGDIISHILVSFGDGA